MKKANGIVLVLFVAMLSSLLFMTGCVSAQTKEEHDLICRGYKEAGCSEDGNIEYWECRKCGKIFSDEKGENEISIEDTVIPATAHQWGDWMPIGEISCDGGTEYRECSVCKTREERSVSATDHEFVMVLANEPTCTEDGNIDYMYCKKCGKYFYDSGVEIKDVTLPATGHKMSYIEKVDATCSENGNSAYYYCKKCGGYFFDEKGETETTKEEILINATGLHEYYDHICSVCNQPEIGYSSEGLEMSLSWDESYYIVTGFRNTTETTIILPDTYQGKPVKEIYPRAFANNGNLKRIYISANIEEAGERLFANCRNLERIIVDKNNPYFHSDGDCMIKTESKVLFAGCKNSVIPDDGSVVKINDWAFDGCRGIESIVVPECVSSIGRFAFYQCNDLQEITLPFIGANGSDDYSYFGYIFGADEYSENSSYVPSSLKTVNISGNYPIYSNAFYGCGNIEEISAENDIAFIGDYAFRNCTSLLKFTIAGENCEMGYGVLQGCSGIVEVSVPYVKGKGTDYFGCLFGVDDYENNSGIPSSLERVALTGGTSVGDNYFRNMSGIKSVVIADTFTSMGANVLTGCNALESVTIPFVGEKADGSGSLIFGHLFGMTGSGSHMTGLPQSLKSIRITSATKIGYYALADMRTIDYIYLPDTLTDLDRAFTATTAEIVWGENPAITELRDECMRGYSGTSFTIPESVTRLGDAVFYQCENLVDLYVHPGIVEFGSKAFSIAGDSLTFNEYDNAYYLGNAENPYVLLFKAKTTDITACAIHEDTLLINNNAFYGCRSLANIILPAGIRCIGEEAFSNCTSMDSINIEDTKITELKYGTFSDCDSLVELILPDSVTSIENAFLFGCENLRKITLSENVVYFDGGFEYCDSLEFNEYGNGLYLGDDENPYTVFVKVKDKNVAEFAFHEKTNVIMEYAFKDYTSASEITIVDNIRYIGYAAFAGSTATIKWDESPALKKIGNGVFREYAGESIVIPEGFDEIGYSAFAYSKIKSIQIPQSVISIEDSAFDNCSNLLSVTLPDAVTVINRALFFCCSSLREVNLSKNTTSIGENAFYGCESLEKIEIPQSVTVIDNDSIFTKSSAVIDWGETPGITEIGGMSFYQYKGKTLTIPVTVTKISGAPFYEAEIETIIYEGTIAQWRNIEQAGSWNNHFENYVVKCIDGTLSEAQSDN